MADTKSPNPAAAQAYPEPASPDAALAAALERFNQAVAAQQQRALTIPPAPTFGGPADPLGMDTRSGAPAAVRMAVGAAVRPEDRLATLQRSYPDAKPYGQGNFVFTEPRTGQPTLYNPRGFDLGDLASLVPEAAELGGGLLGGGVAAASAPATGGAGLLAVPAGVGLGAAAGRELAQNLATTFGGTVDRRGLLERLGDAGVTAGVNAVAEPAGRAVAAGARALVGPVRRAMQAPTGAAAVRDFEALGVPLSAGATTGNKTMQVIERGVGSMPGGAGRMEAVAERQGEALGEAVGNTARGLAGGEPEGVAAAGTRLRQAADAASERFDRVREEAYDEAYRLIGADTPTALPTVQQLAAEVRADIARAPLSRGETLGPVTRRLAALTADAGQAGTIGFEAVRNIRTDLGRFLKTPRTAATAPSNDARIYLERLYGALTEDVNATARQAGPEAARRLELADRYNRMHVTRSMPALRRILEAGTDEKAFAAAFPQSGRPDGQALMRLTRSLSPEDRKALAATVLDRMGLPTAGAGAGEGFSAARFLTNWNLLTRNGPEARLALFGADRQLATQLDRLARVSERLRDAGRTRNFSNTAPTLLAGAAAATAGSQAMEGDMGGVMKTLGVSLIAPRLAAHLITSPAFVRWAADTAPAAMRGAVPESAVQALVRVGAMNPQLREAVEALRLALRPAPQPEQRGQ